MGPYNQAAACMHGQVNEGKKKKTKKKTKTNKNHKGEREGQGRRRSCGIKRRGVIEMETTKHNNKNRKQYNQNGVHQYDNIEKNKKQNRTS